LLESFEIKAPRDLERLRERLTMTYSILDPIMPIEGKFLARWRLQLNVSPEEIEAVVRT
jgi:predicted transcriptional regulator of viral defense system